MIEPSGSSVLSLVVLTVNVAGCLWLGCVTVSDEPVVAPKLPLWETVRLTVSDVVGAGVAVTVKLASAPSVDIHCPRRL